MRLKSFIAVILGSLVLVNLGHNIIPHHHHMDDMHSHDGCEQHDIEEQAVNHASEAESPAHHCHAFNGFEYVLSPEVKIEKSPHVKTSGMYSALLINQDEPLPREMKALFSGIPPPDLTGFLGESSGLRAPPIIS